MRIWTELPGPSSRLGPGRQRVQTAGLQDALADSTTGHSLVVLLKNLEVL